MQTSTSWFSDPDTLLETIRKSRRPAIRAPAIPGYRDLRELKRGGQGVVYHALQISTKRPVAIKVLAGGVIASAAALRRFEREVDLAATLEHPSIVRIYDSGQTPDGHPFFVMEFIDGIPLDALIKNEAEPVALRRADLHATVRLFIRICDAVSYAHQRGVIHRDLKPSNIRVDAKGEPHVLDFGLAKAVADPGAEANGTQVSVTGEFMGSLPWASPEQAAGDPDQIDVRTDVYSLGVCLFQLLTGQFPYRVVGPFREVLDAIATTTPSRPSVDGKPLDDELSTIVLKCLEKEPPRRYQSAAELARDLRHYLAGEPIEAKRDSGWYVVRKVLRQHRAAVVVTSLIFISSIIAALTMAVLYQRASAAERMATAALADARSARELAVNEQLRTQREAEKLAKVNSLLTNMLRRPLATGREARVADILDDTRRELDAGPRQDPRIELALRSTLGQAYGQLGMYAEARAQLERSAELALRHRGPDHPETLEARRNLAWLAHLEGKLSEAESGYRAVLADQQRTLGQDAPTVMTTRNDLAIVLSDADKTSEAELLLRQTVEFARAHPETIEGQLPDMLGNLADTLHATGRTQEAEALMRERIEICRSTHGDEHLNTANAQNNLAVLLSDLGELDEAIELQTKALRTRERLLGPDHPETLIAMMNLAAAKHAQGNLQEASRLYRQAAVGLEARLGPNHVRTLTALSNLGSIMALTGDAIEAERLDRQVLERRTAALGPDHDDTLVSANNLATCLFQLERWDDASRLLSGVIETLRKKYGEEHPTTLKAENNLCSALLEMKRFEQARRIAQRVYAATARVRGGDHPDTLMVVLTLAHAEGESGNPAKAAEILAPALDAARRALGANHYLTAVIEGHYGRYLVASGQSEAGIQRLRASVEALTTIFGENHARTVKMRERLNEATTASESP